MRAPPGDRRVAEPVGHENLGQADGIPNDDQGDSYTHGHGYHGHAYGYCLDCHGHADTDAHDVDVYVNNHADTNPGADPVSHRYRR